VSRVVVTGGAGFLGSHLTRRLLTEGHQVTVLDNLQTGTLANLPELGAHPRLTFVNHDVTEPWDVACDRVYNLACAASPPRYQAAPIHTTLTSVLGMHHALEVARRHGARVLQASTSEVYGDPEDHPQREAYRGSVSTVGPRACYDEGKRCAEALVCDHHRRFGTDVRIARIFNTYGPGMSPDDGRVVTNFLIQALRGEPLTVYGDGAQTRSLCYVDDLIEGLVGLMERTAHTGPVNLGNPAEITVLELARTIAGAVPGSRIEHAPLPVDDPQRRCPDISLARSLFGFEPRVALAVGLERTLEDLRARTAPRPASRPAEPTTPDPRPLATTSG
jgi:UDP-glucuronate decarboxylase